MPEKSRDNHNDAAPALAADDAAIPRETLLAIIRAGVQAPSGDNAQPWKFSWHGNTIRLFLDRQADQSFFNVRQLASILSCGAVLENMRLAASAFGLQAKVFALPEPSNPDLMGRLELFSCKTAAHPLAAVIGQRHTNRRTYAKKPFPPELAQTLEAALAQFPGARLHWVREPDAMRRLARLIFQVDRIRSEHRALHLHLCKMIRWTDAETQATGDGLPLKNLEAGAAGEFFLKLSRPWRVMDFLNRIGFGKLIALHSYQGIMASSAAALLTVPGSSAGDFLLGGQALEHVWLELTRCGLMVQPMAAITLFWMRWRLEGEKDFSGKHQDLLRPVWQEYRKLFPEVDFERHGQVMLFRCGYGQPIRQRTLRKDVEKFFLC